MHIYQYCEFHICLLHMLNWLISFFHLFHQVVNLHNFLSHWDHHSIYTTSILFTHISHTPASRASWRRRPTFARQPSPTRSKRSSPTNQPVTKPRRRWPRSSRLTCERCSGSMHVRGSPYDGQLPRVVRYQVLAEVMLFAYCRDALFSLHCWRSEGRLKQKVSMLENSVSSLWCNGCQCRALRLWQCNKDIGVINKSNRARGGSHLHPQNAQWMKSHKIALLKPRR